MGKPFNSNTSKRNRTAESGCYRTRIASFISKHETKLQRLTKVENSIDKKRQPKKHANIRKEIEKHMDGLTPTLRQLGGRMHLV